MFKNHNQVCKLIRQGARWEYTLVHCLHNLKGVYGMRGVLEFLDKELSQYDRYAIHKSHYFMRLVNIIEKMQKLGITRSTYQQLPLSYWNYIIRYVSIKNIQDIIDFIYRGGKVKTLAAEFKKGFILKFNVFIDEFEFVTGGESNENPDS